MRRSSARNSRRAHQRSGKFVARLGGEEFVVVWEGWTAVAVGMSAEALRAAVELTALRTGTAFPQHAKPLCVSSVTTSILQPVDGCSTSSSSTRCIVSQRVPLPRRVFVRLLFQTAVFLGLFLVSRLLTRTTQVTCGFRLCAVEHSMGWV